MKRLYGKVVRFLAAEDGPTAVEYAMLVLLVFLACMSVIIVIGQSTASSFHDSQTRIEKAADQNY